MLLLMGKYLYLKKIKFDKITFTAYEFALGNDETGSAMAPEHIITHAKTNILACPICSPTFATIGRTTIAATVEEIKVPIDKTNVVKVCENKKIREKTINLKKKLKSYKHYNPN